MADNRPHGRKRNVTGTGSVFRRGDGLGSGPVGNSSRPSSGGSGPRRSGGGRSPLSLIIILAVLLLGGGGFGLSSLTGGSGSGSGATQTQQSLEIPSGWTFGNQQMSATGNYANTSVNDAEPDRSVSPKARAKYVDTANARTATVLVYMCGADLESRSGMATRDLNEMIQATHSDKVKIIIETGGARSWQNQAVSNQRLQRWEVVDGGIRPLVRDAGDASMTDAATLRDFVDWGMKNYRSDRMMLILWDHGGGSVTGYGYDERYNNGSMTIDRLAGALKNYKSSFDFIGFDACLMATLETAIAMEPYSDYLIASEETEPGTGWYYTDWLTSLAANPAIPTTDLGKVIIDTYTEQSQGTTTLSLTDLAELHGTIGTPLGEFSAKLKEQISSDEARQVADARAGAKEFARSSAIDQVDLTDFATKLDTPEGRELAKTVEAAVKYNRTRNISNAHGLSVYFPYRNNRLVSQMTNINNAIDMDSDYTGAMRSFATLNASAQTVTQQQAPSLFDLLGGAMPQESSSVDASSILQQLTGGQMDLGSLLGGSTGVDTGSFEQIANILGRSRLSSDELNFTEKDGRTVLALSEDEWKDIHEINLNVWIDDGTGYIDLGYDNIYDFDDDGDLIADYDGDWIALDGHPAAVYSMDTEYDKDGGYTFHSYIPALLNGERVKILIEYSDQNEDGEILGAQKVYDSGTTGKGLIRIESGDQIDLLCDYYDYSGNYQDTYYLGDAFTVGDELELSDVELTNTSCRYGYALKDTWNTTRYTPFLSE